MQVPTSGVKGFLVDYSLSDLYPRKTRDKICQQCNENNKAVSYCKTCSDYFCDSCLQAHKRNSFKIMWPFLALLECPLLSGSIVTFSLAWSLISQKLPLKVQAYHRPQKSRMPWLNMCAKIWFVCTFSLGTLDSIVSQLFPKLLNTNLQEWSLDIYTMHSTLPVGVFYSHTKFIACCKSCDIADSETLQAALVYTIKIYNGCEYSRSSKRIEM